MSEYKNLALNNNLRAEVYNNAIANVAIDETPIKILAIVAWHFKINWRFALFSCEFPLQAKWQMNEILELLIRKRTANKTDRIDALILF